MTAIDKFIRLEAIGYWFEAGRQEGREVIVSFGDATLQLTSLKDQPLTHWSLLATQRIGTRGEAVIYSADPEQHEILEIEDRDMIRAISAVTSALAPPPPPSKRRWIWRWAALALVAFGLFLSPPLITKTATLLTPPARAAALSEALQGRLSEDFGNRCEGWQGLHALNALADQLFPDRHVQILVFENQPSPSLALPNEVVSLSRALVEQAADAETLAMQVTLAWAMSENTRPLAAYISSLGAFGALRTVIAGTLPPPEAAPTTLIPQASDFLLARDHLRAQGISVLALQAKAKEYGIGLPLGPSPTTPLAFTFEDFAALQSICAE